MSGSATSTRTIARGRVHGDGAGGGGLAHDLAVHLAFGGDVDDDIALNRGLAAEAPALGEAAHAVVAFLDRVPFGQGVGRDGDAMLGEIAVRGETWHLEQMPRPPQTLSRSTPSWRAAVRTGCRRGSARACRRA
jgi:hypothetical protein